MRRYILALFAVCILLPAQAHALSCWCCTRPQSMLDRYLEAEIVVVGRLENAVQPNNALPNGQTEIVFDEVIKPHKAIKDRKSIFTPRPIVAKGTYLMAIDVNKGEFDASSGTELDPQGAILKYVRGALNLKDKSSIARLRYNLDFLSDANKEVAQSAHTEFTQASRADVRQVARNLKPEPLVQAMKDTPEKYQRGNFAQLLGYCGKKEHAVIFRKQLDERDPQTESLNLSPQFFAYAMLDPDAGWDYAARASADEKGSSFLRRYAALQAIRHLGEERKELMGQKKWQDAMLAMLKIHDMADFAIEDLRKLKRWEHSDTILDLWGKPGYTVPIMRRAILRYALQSPNPRATAFVAEQRARDAEWVADTQELLDLE